MATLYRVPTTSPSGFVQETGALAIGVDIGGTKIAAGIVDGEGRILNQLRSNTPASEPEAIEAEVVRLVAELSSDPLPVGVAAAGFIDAAQSEVYYAPNIRWRNVPLRERLEAQLGRTVTIDNDANAAGWAEYRFGAGRGCGHMTMITIGTGVGGAIVANGGLLRGGFGAAAELGHLRLVPDGELCGCGQHGCLESVGSGRALMRELNRLADAGGIGLSLAAVREREGALTAENVTPLMLAGDEGALTALDAIGRAIGAGCASLSAVLDPERFVFGGGVAIAGEALLAPIRAAFAATQPARGYHPEPEFRIAELGNEAGMVGAADLARIYLRPHTSAK